MPLLGFVPWGLVEGRHALWEPAADGRVAPHTEKMPVEEFHEHEKHFAAVCAQRVKSIRINPNHSHLFLVDDGTVGNFNVEAGLRASFEVRTLPPPSDALPLTRFLRLPERQRAAFSSPSLSLSLSLSPPEEMRAVMARVLGGGDVEEWFVRVWCVSE